MRLRRFRPIPAQMVAAAMVGAARTGGEGHHVYRFDDIVRLATSCLKEGQAHPCEQQTNDDDAEG